MNMNTPIGGGGFVQPKPPANNFGGGFSNTQKVNTVGSNFGSNFGSNTANQGFGSNFGSSKPSSSKNNLLGMAGAGLAGGLVGGSMKKGFSKNPYGVSQYSGFKKPKKSFGSYLFGGSGSKKSFGYKTPGYGTNWGTNFAGGMGQYKKPKKGISKKALGLGIGAGFLGGAAVGVAGTMATYSVYHKYQEFKRMMYMNQMGGMGGMGGMGMNGMGGMGGPGLGVGMMGGARGWDDDYYQVPLTSITSKH